MRRKKMLKVVVLLLVVLYVLWKFFSGSLFSGTGGDTALLSGRPWFERMPGDMRDRVHSLMMIKVPGQQVGAVSHSSVFSRHFEIVKWKLDDQRLNLEVL